MLSLSLNRKEVIGKGVDYRDTLSALDKDRYAVKFEERLESFLLAIFSQLYWSRKLG